MQIDFKALIEQVVKNVEVGMTEDTFSFDATGWTLEDIRELIEEARTHVQGKPVKLKGVRVGKDVFIQLGGAKGGFVNAQFQNDVPIVQTEDTGTVELVFSP
jgi:hypothetical protein